MNKTPIIPLLFCLLLASCSKPADLFSSYKEAQSALISLNTALSAQKNLNSTGLSNEQLPFTDSYLARRHAIYQQLMQMKLSAAQTHQVNYLVIAERFPERYFAWPAHTDVLSNMLSIVKNDAQYKNIEQWLIFVKSQLQAAEKSNLKLNKIEHNYLKHYVQQAINSTDTPIELNESLSVLNNYLMQYKPRGSIGLSGLANGSQWYQSKLNYFANDVLSPLEWLSLIDSKFKTMQSSTEQLTVGTSDVSQLSETFLKETQVLGLDWSTGYRLLPQLASTKQLTAADKRLYLAMMETDLGVHYHAWTLSQARLNLLKRLNISEEDARILVEDIIFYPGQSFSFAPQLLI
ncbi:MULTISPECIES: hypothetical protein [unclassified Pseudoalteromonas]|uniref:hypothetical protein n=1 Tax=unclassified Pseudoalteromonas TaxID=194690 RepID=UPI00390CAE51|nr:hypothetical protein [Ningiella sp. W23]